MTRYTFFLRYALNGIKRGGQRIIIATLAVAFGVMSLISMADIADSIDRTLTSDPRVSLGGDLRLSNPTQEIFTTLQSLQDKGDISSYSHIQQAPFLLMRTANDGRANFVQSGIGINPATYPLVGDFVISQPAQVTPTDLLQEIGSALITRDLASKHQISIGDTIRIAQNDGTMATISLIVMGIISDTPEHTGSRIYYNLETSVQLLGNRGSIQDYVVINTDNPEHVKQQLNGQIQQVDLSTTTPSQSGAFFDFMLRGAGVLGLIVGGIGIANTMQVLLTQRRNEVGILKALGYSQRDMIVIFVLESMLIGLIGSFLGVVMALLLSQGLIQLFANISTLLVTWQLNMILILTSMLTGIATTIIFAFYAILRTSRTRPNVIFRRTLENQRTWQTRFQSLGFYGLLAIPFAGVTGLFLGSVIEGIGIVLFSIAGFLFLSLIIWFMMWAILRVLPTLRSNLLRIARNNMRKRISSMLFAMIALFVGIFTLGFALTVVQVGIDQFNERDASADAGYNILVYADTDTVSQIVELMPITQVDYRYVTSLHRDGTAVQIRQHTWDIEIVGGIEFGTQNGLYVADSS
ncbi:MAG: FtsX-like permease family protein, partial [Chloroflexota bacterium]